MSMAVKGSMTVQRSMPGIGYRGDPGLFGFLGGLGKKVIGAVGTVARAGFLPSPLVGAAGILGGILGRKTAKARQMGQAGMVMNGASPMISFGSGFQRPGGRRSIPRPGIRGFLERGFTGGATGMIPATANGNGPPGPGYHLNKSDYYVRSDPMNPESAGLYVAKGTVWVKNRRRNPLNPRALSRAMGRLTSAKNAAKAMGRITIRKEC